MTKGSEKVARLYASKYIWAFPDMDSVTYRGYR